MDADKSQLRFASILIILIILALFLTVRVVYLYLADPGRYPINTVKISASYQHVSHKQLEQILANYLNTSFFSLPVSRLHAELSALSWIKEVQIERIWPDTLKISLIEKQPVAIWNESFLCDDGDVFSEKGELTDTMLPQLKGPVDHQKQVLQVYKKMSKILSICGLYAAVLEWRKNEAWELTLSNGVKLRLGKRDLETRVNRFCKAYPAVFAEKTDQLANVDLRYPRGMAVQWKN